MEVIMNLETAKGWIRESLVNDGKSSGVNGTDPTGD